MKRLKRMWARVRGLFSPRDEEIVREMQAHFEMAVDEYLRRGYSPDDATRRARVDAGSIDGAAEAWRDQDSIPLGESLLRDLRFAWRGLRRRPKFAAGIIVSLALGIGLNTSIFAVTDAVLRRSLPYPDAGRIVATGHQAAGLSGDDRPTWATYGLSLNAWRGARSFDETAVWSRSQGTIATATEAQYVTAGRASASLLRVLGASPLRGRWFAEKETGVVVLSEVTWRRQFNADSQIVGRTVLIDGRLTTIIGVLPRGIGLPVGAAYWLPAGDMGGELIGRLRPAISYEAARLELETLSPVVARYRKEGKPFTVLAAPLGERLYGTSKPALVVLSLGALLLLLITTANVANLALARTIERRREFAMRIAVGASARSLGSLLILENLLLAAIGAAAGILLAVGASRFFVSLAPRSVAVLDDFAVHGAQVGFAAALALIACLLVSAAPVAAATQGMPSSFGLTGHQAGRGRGLRRLRHGLVAAQLALTIMLLVGAGLLLRTVDRLTRPEHLGFDPSDVVALSLRPVGARYDGANRAARRQFLDELERKIRALPGVIAVSSGPAPLVAASDEEGYSDGFNSMFLWGRPGSGESTELVWVKEVDSTYQRLYGIRLQAGRWFASADRAGSPPVAMINRTAARLFFGDRDPVGLLLDRNVVGDAYASVTSADAGPPTVIGIVADVQQRGLGLAPNPEVYLPAIQRPARAYAMLSIKASLPATAVIREVRRLMQSMDPSIAAARLQPMDDVVTMALARHNFVRRLLGMFAILGLVLSMVGLYAIISYLVSQRTTEIGVRMALGAQARDIARMVLGEAAMLVAIGVAAGIPLTLAGTRLLSAFLYEVRSTDIVSFTAAPLLLTLVALSAAWMPIRRATRVPPVTSLRTLT